MNSIPKIVAVYVSSLLILLAVVGACHSEEPYKSWSADQKRVVARMAYYNKVLKQLEYIQDGLRRNRVVQDPKSGRLLDMAETEFKSQGARQAPPPNAGPWGEVETQRLKDGTTKYIYTFRLLDGRIHQNFYGGSTSERDLIKIREAMEAARYAVRDAESRAISEGLNQQQWKDPNALEAVERDIQKYLDDKAQKDKADFIGNLVEDLQIKSDVKVNWGEETTREAGEDTKKSQDGGIIRKEEMTSESHQSATTTATSNSWSTDGSKVPVEWGEQSTREAGEDATKSQDVSVDWGSETTSEAGQTATSSGAVYPTKFDDRIQWNDLQGNPGTRNVTPPGGYTKPPTYNPITGTYVEDRWQRTPSPPRVGILPARPLRPPQTPSRGVRSNSANDITDISGLRLPVRPIPFNPSRVSPPSGTSSWLPPSTGPSYDNDLEGAIRAGLREQERNNRNGVPPTKTGQPTNIKKGGSDPYAPLNLQPNRTSANIKRPTGTTVNTTNIKTGTTRWNPNHRRIPNNVNRTRKGTVLR